MKTILSGFVLLHTLFITLIWLYGVNVPNDKLGLALSGPCFLFSTIMALGGIITVIIVKLSKCNITDVLPLFFATGNFVWIVGLVCLHFWILIVLPGIALIGALILWPQEISKN